MNGMATCDLCGTVVVKRHLGRHKRGGRCIQATTAPLNAHCRFCQRPGIKAIFDRLKAGETVDTVAYELGVSLQHIQRSRTRGRSAGCLPKSSQESRLEEARVLALQRHGERTCCECKKVFVPRLNTPTQSTCNKRCQEKRKERMRRVSLGLPARSAPQSPERLEEEMEPQRLTIEEMTRQADSVPMLTGEESHALWFRCLGVAA